MRQTFGQTLKGLRQGKNLSQRELAQKAGVDFTYISKLENDRLPPPAADTVIRFAEILETPEEILLAPAGKMNSDLKDIITNNPEAVKFLNEVKGMGLTSEEWGLLTKKLKKLR
jgi:transcriptional regulator with XRE-family HTH domain